MVYSSGHTQICEQCGKPIIFDCYIDDTKSKYPSCDEVLDLNCVHAQLLTEIDWQKADKDKKYDIALKIVCPKCNYENKIETSISIDPFKNLKKLIYRNKNYFEF